MGGGRKRGISTEREEGYFKGRDGRREREREDITKEGKEGGRNGITKGGMVGWKDEDRYGRYYKGSGEAGMVLQMEGWREGGCEGRREGEGGRENITNEIIETVISDISNIYDVMA